MEEKILRTETDPRLLEAVSVSLKQAEQMETDFEEHGLRIIGLDVSGHAADLQDFKGRRSFTRVIELKEAGRPQPAIVPNQ